VTKYEFLAALHELLQPKTYLEIGVQAGGSLNLAARDCSAIGIDPHPLVPPRGHNQSIHTMTSDDFFLGKPDLPALDLVFIDGMHLFEYALRDFMNVQTYGHEKTVYVFDDVLPYNEAIADRVQPPGDWTGDVWKLTPIIAEETGLESRLVNVHSTGALVVWGHYSSLAGKYDKIVKKWMDKPIPAWVFNRDFHMDPHDCLEELRTR